MTPAQLIRSAELLEQYADEISEGNRRDNGDWNGPKWARQYYDLTTLATALREQSKVTTP